MLRSLTNVGVAKHVARPLRAAAVAVSRSARFSTTTFLRKEEEEPLQNLSELPRKSNAPIHAPIENPADKYKETTEELHKFGRYIMSCMPKYIQQFSVWKDELVLYIAPSAVRIVMIFLKNHTPAQFKA